MEESVTYQAIVAEGAAKGAREELRKVLLTQGAELFGEPAPDWATEALAKIEDLAQLEALATKIVRVESWKELLTAPRKAPRRKKGDS